MRKLSYTYIKEQIESDGYKLLSAEYFDVNSTLTILCDRGHTYETCFTVWKRGGRCRYCQHDKMRLTIDFISNEFAKEGYKLLSTEYKNTYGRLDFICPNGHKHFTTWCSWQSGCRCGKCAKNVRFTTEFVKSCFEKEYYTLLTEQYINQKQKLQYICPIGHLNEIMFSDWLYGNCRCSKCKPINMMGSGNYNWKGGPAPYCDVWSDKEYKESIKERDNYECQNPNCSKKQGNASQLTVHHIDYNKKNCGPDNLITLCRSCNARANYDRDWHTEWYRVIMDKKYNYTYGGI